MKRSRKYKSGSRWAFWRWTQTDSGYLTRLHLVLTPWFAICLHWIHKPDAEPHLHDHPVSFLSLVLRGGYYEFRDVHGRDRSGWRRWFNVVRASELDVHRIALVKRKTLTLCFMSAVRRRWGFHTPSGWIYWRDYNRERYPKQPENPFV